MTNAKKKNISKYLNLYDYWRVVRQRHLAIEF